ncbi:MAG: prolipoprotein diacylglyceryl transferase [Planctomycetaceae bacterium]|nr:prolipoprotein diacylglyceryl transferase [Planctomycetaceae bacterium]
MIGRIAYGMLFCVFIPLALAFWAVRLDLITRLPKVHSVSVGVVLTAAGLSLMSAGMLALWRHGGGLPMNAFPPPRRVTCGVYRWLAHPIYTGFCVAVCGVAVLVGSSAGFWIITPLAIFGCTAIVLGYEQEDLRQRLGEAERRPLLSLPAATESPPSFAEVLAVEIVVFVPWLILYESIGHLPVHGPVETYLASEREWPVKSWTVLVYTAAYPFVVISPWCATSCRGLRRFATAGIAGTMVGMLLFVVLPFVATPRFDGSDSSVFSRWIEMELADGVGGRNAFPSFHVFWSLLAAWLIARRGRWWALAGWIFAVAISVSCVTTGMHSMADVFAGGVLFLGVSRWDVLQRKALALAERVANSWKEWRIGPLRVINHGIYAGLAATVGMLVASSLVGNADVASLALLAVSSLIGAALWGQYFVGSKTLLRPFGYFGSIAGAAVVAVLCLILGQPIWLTVGAAAVAAPWVQAIGRLRCLVQGCCHGAPTRGSVGLRYNHPRSRVLTIAGLGQVPIHPTPLYSIAGNVVIGLFLHRLWSVGAIPTLIAGFYLVLSGLARFIEESLRGEPQTPIVRGLRLYQWFAIGSIVIGVAMTWVDSTTTAAGISLDPGRIGLAAAIGMIHFIAMGVDLPESNRRFSRLV